MFKFGIEIGIYIITILMIIAFLTPLVKFMYEVSQGSLSFKTHIIREKSIFNLNIEMIYNGSEVLEKTVLELKFYKGDQIVINKTYDLGTLKKGDRKMISIEIPEPIHAFTAMELQLKCVVTNLYPIAISYKQILGR
ncbi:MAG: hypothetical protein DRO15_03300 [Thermoprotei archaeon]|nr:MAG: hypothetical protein DRO15_03300 [Thermoprotei archaeon]